MENILYNNNTIGLYKQHPFVPMAYVTRWRLMDEKLDGRQLEFFVLVA